jgi:hypothetical protein
MNKSEIKEGDYIYEENESSIFINLMKNKERTLHFIRINYGGDYCGTDNTSGIYGRKLLRLATPFEKFWLDTCIEQGKFIKEEIVKQLFEGKYSYEIY